MELERNCITVHVECDRGVVWGDPETLQDRAHVRGWVHREWRHLDTCQFETRIVAEVPRLKYKSGRVEDAAVPWAERYSRITLMMEAFVVRLLQATANISRVASLIKLDWRTVNDVIQRAVQRGLARRAQEPVRHLGLDEKSFARGHNYASVLTDIDRSRVLEVTPGRKLEDAQRVLCSLSPEQRAGVRAIAMDMWPAYMSAAGTLLANADIVHDKFHVSKYLNDAVDQVRRTEHKRLRAQAVDKPLGLGSAMFGQGGVVPYRSLDAQRASYPMLRFPSKVVKQALSRLASVTPKGEVVQLAYVNPETGRECLPTLGFSAIELRPGEEVRLPKRSASAVMHVVEGSGTTVVDCTENRFEDADSRRPCGAAACPPWHRSAIASCPRAWPRWRPYAGAISDHEKNPAAQFDDDCREIGQHRHRQTDRGDIALRCFRCADLAETAEEDARQQETADGRIVVVLGHVGFHEM